MPPPRITRVPPLNPLRWIPANDVKGPLYNTWKFDHAFFYEQVRRQQTPRQYIQKMMQQDRLPVYIDTMAVRVNIYLIDCQGREYAGLEMNHLEDVPGNTYDPAPGESYQYTSMYYELPIADQGLDDGIYYAVLDVYYETESGPSYPFVSEPIWIRGSWPKTMLLEYGNSINNYDVMFGVIPDDLYAGRLPFAMRVEAFLDDPEPASIDTVFRDVKLDLRNLKSDPYRRRELTIGGSVGVPAYTIEKVGRLLACDSIYADDTRVIKDEATLQITTVKNEFNQLRTGSIYLQEKQEQNNWVFEFPGSIGLLALITDEGSVVYPFAINYLGMNNGFTSIITDAVVIDDETALTEYIGWLNTVFLPANGGTGSYFVSVGDNTIYYNNGIGERYNALPGMFTFVDYVGFYVNTDLNHTLYYDFNAVGTSCMVIADYGDGFIESRVGSTINLVRNTAGMPSQRVRLFHAGSNTAPDLAIEYINLNGTSYVLNFMSNDTYPRCGMPGTLQRFAILYAFGYGDIIDTTIFRTCKDTIERIYFTFTVGGVPVVFSQAVFDIFSGGSIFSVIKQASFFSFNMNTTMVNAIITAFESNTSIDYPGVFSIQTPSGTNPPTGPALAFLNYLQATWGWTIIHD